VALLMNPNPTVIIPKKFQIGMFVVMSILLLAEGFTQWKIHTLLWENSHVMSGLIQTEWFYVSNNRLGMYATQILPLIGLKLNFPDSLVIILQSLNYVLLPLALIAWVMFRWKNVPHAVFIFFVMTLGAFYIHFSKEYALVNSLLYSVVMAAFIQSKWEVKNKMHYLILIAFLILILYTFTLALFFIVPLLWFYKDKLGIKMFVLAILTIAGVFAITFLQSTYIMNNVAAVGGDKMSMRGVHVVVQALKKIGWYYSTIMAASAILMLFFFRKMDRKIGLILGIHIAFLAIAIRYLIAVCGNVFEFDISNLILIRVEVTLFIILASIIYFSLAHLEWKPWLMYLIFLLAVGRFIFLNVITTPVNAIITQKEFLVNRLATDYPDKKVFLVSRDCNFIPNNYELDDFKHESFVISTYLGKPILVYLTNHFEVYEEQGRPQFVNKTQDASVNFYDEATYEWRFDPLLEYPKMKIQAQEIEKVLCP
jgi:hypothetical protein